MVSDLHLDANNKAATQLINHSPRGSVVALLGYGVRCHRCKLAVVEMGESGLVVGHPGRSGCHDR
eukprot:5349509-Pyramimonas_sp.AAC.1